MITEKQLDAAAAAFDEFFNTNPFDELTSGKKVARLMLEAALGLNGQAQPDAAQEEDEVVQLINQRDHREDIINQLCDAVLGPNRQEWSSAYHFEDAVRDVQEQVQAHETADDASIPPQFDVRKILLKIEPGPDGSGVELYATSVADVQRMLSDMSLRLERDTNGQKMPAATNDRAQKLDAMLTSILNRRVAVEQELFDMANGKKPMPDAAKLRELAMKLGDPAIMQPRPQRA